MQTDTLLPKQVFIHVGTFIRNTLFASAGPFKLCKTEYILKGLHNIYNCIFSSKDDKYVPSDQKILIDALGKFQAKLESVDNFDHVILPPLYKQVVR